MSEVEWGQERKDILPQCPKTREVREVRMTWLQLSVWQVREW